MAKARLPFKIRRLEPGETPAPPQRAPQPPEPEPETPPVAEAAPGEGAPAATGGIFPSPAGVLAFLAAVAGMRLADEAASRHDIDGGWWAEVDLPWETAAPLVRAAGGRPYQAVGERWLEVPILDQPAGEPTLDVRAWAPVELADLVTTQPLRRVSVTSSPELDVVVPGALGRWVLRRATALGLETRLSLARRRPLRGEGEEVGVLVVRLRCRPRRLGRGHERRSVPLSLVQALTSLPYVVVGRPAGPEGERLMVDIRHRPPLSASLIAGMIPEDEIWVLGGADVGHWRLTLTGEEIAGTRLLDRPTVELVDAPLSGAAHLPTRLPVRLVARADRPGPTDALLLDESELGWLQHFLMTRPSGERAFLIPGAERYLLTAPGGLTGTLPFGVPLTRRPPHGLYVEAGLDFFPPLPEGARRDIFNLDEGGVVAVVEDEAYRFELERLVPAWTLWIGEAPEVQAEVSAGSEVLLAKIGEILREQEARIAAPQARKDEAPREKVDRSRLLEEAQKAEIAGDLVRAAELLETAGDLGPAGRLYERAAMEGR